MSLDLEQKKGNVLVVDSPELGLGAVDVKFKMAGWAESTFYV